MIKGSLHSLANDDTMASGIVCTAEFALEFQDIAIYGFQIDAQRLGSTGFIVGENFLGVTIKNVIIDDYRDNYDIPDFGRVLTDAEV